MRLLHLGSIDMKMKSLLFLAFLGFFVGPLVAADAAKKPWKNSTELSVVSSNGNTKAQSTSGKNTFLYDWTKTTLEVIGGGMGARSKGETIAERYFASEKVSYKLSDRNYAFEKFGWDKDRFAGIRNRYDSGVGLGREVLKSAKSLLIAELGGGYIKEERLVGKDASFAVGRAYSKYTRTLSATANFSQDAEYIHNFENPDDFRTKTETALTAAINTAMSLKVSYVWKHVGQPPVGFTRNDTITTVSLVATY